MTLSRVLSVLHLSQPRPGLATASAGRRRLGIADELLVQQVLTLLLPDGDDLVALEHDRVGSERRRDAVADDREQRTAVGDGEIARRAPDRRRAHLEMRLDELELALAEGRQVEQLVDRDVLLDRAEDHPGR